MEDLIAAYQRLQRWNETISSEIFKKSQLDLLLIRQRVDKDYQAFLDEWNKKLPDASSTGKVQKMH